MTPIRNILVYIWFVAVMIIRLPLRAKVNRLMEAGEFEEAQRRIHAFAKRFASTGCRLLGVKITVEGLENIPEEGSVLYVGNHQSMFDPPLMLAVLPRPSGFICKEELGKVPLFSKWVAAIGSFFLPRTESRKSLEVILNAAKMLKQHDHGMCVFPEGTRSDDGNMRPFKAGSLKIATRSGAAIVPFALEHTIDVMPRGSIWIRPLAVRVTFLPAILPEDYKGKDTSTLSESIQSDIARVVGCSIVEDAPDEKESEEKE